MLKRLFRLNKHDNRVMVQCRTLVNREAIRRESIDGVEHIIVSSSTLPDDIVMNGGLYPADEIEAGYESLELTLAPVEHPQADGQFISANDPRAIHGFHAGAFNMNVRREDGRVHIDKFINVSEAMKTDRGKRLLDRIDEIENNSDPRPIHTSVGVFISVEETDGPQTNAAGDEYEWIARNMVFDHDAILLDSVGAAQPHQGVGVAVNRKGQEFEVKTFSLEGNQSYSEIQQAVYDALEKSAFKAGYIEELFEDRVIFWTDDQLFEVGFTIEDDLASIVGIPVEVDRNVTFTPKTNSEGIDMKELIINALKAAEVETDGLSDDALFSAYNELQVSQSDSEGNGGEAEANASDETGIAEVVANALKPLAAQIEGLQSQLNSSDEAELDRLAGIVANSGRYTALDSDSAKLLGVDKLKEMAASFEPAYGLSPVINSGGVDDSFKAPSDMPQ